MSLKEFTKEIFGVNKNIFIKALEINPSSQGYILGAISELLLKYHLESKGFEVLRIKEKPSGGYKTKTVRGDFYIRKIDNQEDEWYVIESKGLKSNSEFRGSRLDSKEKLLRFIKPLAFHPKNYKEKIYQKGYRKYLKAKQKWESKNEGKTFPPFKWNPQTPGPINTDLFGLWENEKDLKMWVNSQPENSFKEIAYRNLDGPIVILETHSPSKRKDPLTGIEQAAPLVIDFNIMAVDLFLRTLRHEFVFMCTESINHSPTSPGHLYQNYTIDILVKGKRENIIIKPPWFTDIEECIDITRPSPSSLDQSQLDNRINLE